MDVYEAIRNRYSVRSYTEQTVEEQKLHRVLEAGRLAPSGNNRQDWKFIVVRDAELREALAKAADQAFVGKAPVIIAVVSTDPERRMACDIPAGPVDCAIALDHMALAAVAEGLGTCWIGHFDQDACCQLLSIPPTAKIIELLPLGYPADSPKSKSRKPLDKIVCYDSFT